MNLSKRQRQIIELLLNKQGELTSGEIAEAIKVSSRTIHRELAQVEEALRDAGISLLKKSGSGIQLEAEQDKLEAFKQQLSRMNPDHFTARERKVLILCWLLESPEPVKLFLLAHDLHVAVPTVTADLDEIEDWVVKQGLALVRRRGYGVQIIGPEAALRGTIARLAREQLDDSELFGRFDEQPADPLSGELLNMIGREDSFFKVEKVLWQLEDQWPTTLSEADYTMLLISLSVSLTRIRKGRTISPAEASGAQAMEGADSGEQARLRMFVDMMGITLPEEASYIGQQLADWNKQQVINPLLADNLQLADTIVRMIRIVEDRLGVELMQDRTLLDGLIRHAGPALQRLREGIAIRNPLVAQIKKDYEKLFLIVRQAVKDTVAEPSVPDEEIGFLVMHFGASLERLKQFPRHVRALLVCTSGIGSSKLLEVRINKELPQIDLIGRASWFEASRYPEDQYDLIISTVDLPVESDRYIKISPLLTAEEAVKLRTYIQTITLNRLPSVRQESSLSSDALERLRRMSRYSAIILYILDQFECYREDIPPDEFHLKGILSRLCARLRRRSAIDRIEPIVNQLLERESYGSQIIPDTKLALFHTRSEFVPRPVLCLFTLDQPLLLDDQKPVHQILLMLAPLKLSSDSLEVLSEISSMLLSSELIHLLEQGDKASIQQFFSHELEAFLQNKMEWSD